MSLQDLCIGSKHQGVTYLPSEAVRVPVRLRHLLDPGHWHETHAIPSHPPFTPPPCSCSSQHQLHAQGIALHISTQVDVPSWAHTARNPRTAQEGTVEEEQPLYNKILKTNKARALKALSGHCKWKLQDCTSWLYAYRTALVLGCALFLAWSIWWDTTQNLKSITLWYTFRYLSFFRVPKCEMWKKEIREKGEQTAHLWL